MKKIALILFLFVGMMVFPQSSFGPSFNGWAFEGFSEMPKPMQRMQGAAITFDDLIYMIDNEGFTVKDIPSSSNKAMTRAEIEQYVVTDPWYYEIGDGYAPNRLIPYDKILPGIALSPLSYSASHEVGSFDLTITDEHGPPFLISDDAFWLLVSPENGGVSPLVVTVSYQANGTTLEREGTISVTSQATGFVATIDVTQSGNPGTPVDFIALNYGASDLERCDVNPAGSRYIPEGQTFQTATYLYSDPSGINSAPSGWYNDGTRWRRWTGTAFTDGGIC